MERAVVDRIEEGMAVLLVGEDERELAVPLSDLPTGAKPGVWLRVAIEGGRLKQVQVDSETTRQRRARIQEKMDRLLGKPPKEGQ